MPHIEELDADGNPHTPTPINDGLTPTSPSIVDPLSQIHEICSNKFSGLSTMSEALDENNWMTWSKHITSVFKVCQVYGYIQGTIKQPDPRLDGKSFRIWADNDEFAKHIVLINLSPEQLNHVNQEQNAT